MVLNSGRDDEGGRFLRSGGAQLLLVGLALPVAEVGDAFAQKAQTCLQRARVLPSASSVRIPIKGKRRTCATAGPVCSVARWANSDCANLRATVSIGFADAICSVWH